MKMVTKVLMGLLAVPLVLLAAVVVVQTYYHLTPVPLSADALGLNARAENLPTATENGYRLYGLSAPRDQDPVTFGKCLFDAHEQHRREEKASAVKAPAYEDKVLWAEYEKQSGVRSKALQDGCVKDGPLLKLPPLLTELRIKLDTTDDQWTALSAVVPDEAVLLRAAAVRSGGVRRLGAEVDSPLPNYESLMKLERWRVAKGVVAWRNGDRIRATDMWATSIADWAKSANSSLIEAMLSTAVQTQVLIAVQGSVVRSERIDDATANALLHALQPIESMPDSLAESMVGEWQMHVRLMNQLAEDPQRSLRVGIARNVFERVVDRAIGLTFDANATLNALARANLWNQNAMRKAARGDPVPEPPPDMVSFGCATGGSRGMACLPFMRNPVGGIQSAISIPMYPGYGTRVADLRNLATATRLTIEARRRGLAGVALSQFISASPREMRDVFTARAFAYDSSGKRLRIELRERSTILGDKGPYQLPL